MNQEMYRPQIERIGKLAWEQFNRESPEQIKIHRFRGQCRTTYWELTESVASSCIVEIACRGFEIIKTTATPDYVPAELTSNVPICIEVIIDES